MSHPSANQITALLQHWRTQPHAKGVTQTGRRDNVSVGKTRIYKILHSKPKHPQQPAGGA